MATYSGPRSFLSVLEGTKSSRSRSTISSPTHRFTAVSLPITARQGGASGGCHTGVTSAYISSSTTAGRCSVGGCTVTVIVLSSLQGPGV